MRGKTVDGSRQLKPVIEDPKVRFRQGRKGRKQAISFLENRGNVSGAHENHERRMERTGDRLPPNSGKAYSS
jgi:hypothetical protein